MLLRRGKRSKNSKADPNPPISKKIVIWSEKGCAMMAYTPPDQRGLISIRQFPLEADRTKFILGLGNRQIVKQDGDPRVIRARLLGLFHEQRQGEVTPFRLVDTQEEQKSGPIVVVLWSCIDGPEDSLVFMLAIGTGIKGLKQVRRFPGEAQRKHYINSMSGVIRFVEINRLRKIPNSDLDTIIRSKGRVPGTTPSNGSLGSGRTAQQPLPAQQSSRSLAGRYQAIPSQLTGNTLLEKTQELDGCRKSEIVRQCGYSQRRSDGSLRLNYTAFFEALQQAKQAQVKGRTRREGRRGRNQPPVAVDNPAGLKADDLLRLPVGRRLNPAAQARREAIAEALRQEEEIEAQRLRRREERRVERRRQLGLDEPEAPEDMMRIAIRGGAPGQGRRRK